MKPGATTWPVRVDAPAGREVRHVAAEHPEGVAADRHGGPEAGGAGAVDDRAALDEQVELAPSRNGIPRGPSAASVPRAPPERRGRLGLVRNGPVCQRALTTPVARHTGGPS